MLDDRDQHHELGREQEDRRDEEDVRSVIGLVARGLDEQDLGERRAAREQQERHPHADAVALGLEPRGKRNPNRGRAGRDQHEVCDRLQRQPAASPFARLFAERKLRRHRAHARLTLARTYRMSSLS